MSPAEADAKWAAEKAVLMEELLALPRQDKIDLIKAARSYKSGEDSCNSVYMGSMAKHMLRLSLGGDQWSLPEGWEEKATDKQIDAGLDVCAAVISYMRKHPMKKCPTCGQVVPVGAS